MCGISGFYSDHNFTDDKVNFLISDAKSVQKNRGPDNFGIFINREKSSGLFHNRLSLVDLSSLGNQPMKKHGLYITFNGEIYNFREIREELVRLGYDFFSGTDTEVILSAYDAWGERALLKFNGAFAFALYDVSNNYILLARDKVGEKPLYFIQEKSGALYFASTIGLLRKMSSESFQLNGERFLSDLIFNFWSDKSSTHFEKIHTLGAGCVMKISHDLNYKVKKYWDLANTEVENKESEVIANIENLLLDATKIRTDLDTKICSILSGGIDSSLITIMAQRNLDYNLSTFTLEKFGHVDEDLSSARRISSDNDWKNHSVAVRSEDLSLQKLIDVTQSMEEPVLDQVYIYINRNYEEVHRNSFKAVLNGQGSDEILLGYLDYYPFLREENNYKDYQSFRDFWYDRFLLKDYVTKDDAMSCIEKNLDANFKPYYSDDKLNSVLRFGIKTHMPALLIQEDKQSMAWSVECRTVYTDYRLVEYLSRVPSRLKYADGREKYLLRKIANKYLPDYITDRKKLGFPDLPDGREVLIAECLKQQFVEKSEILNRLFSRSMLEHIDELPLGMKWKLCAIAVFEKFK